MAIRMAERNADTGASNSGSLSPITAASSADPIAAAVAAGAAWRSQELWEQSGFLAFLAAHEIKRSDLLGSDQDGGSSSETVERRFFRYEAVSIAPTHCVRRWLTVCVYVSESQYEGWLGA